MRRRERKPWRPAPALRFALIAAAGVLVYFLLGRWLRLPLPFGLHLRLQYAALGFFATVYGPLAGLAAGLLGELALGLAGGAVWWSVAAASALAGFFTGFFAHAAFRREGGLRGGAVGCYVFGGLLAHGLAWAAVCPALDMLLYREALDNLLRRGLSDILSNAACALLGGALLLALFGRVTPGQNPRRREARAEGDAPNAGEPPDDLFDAPV